MHHFSRSGCSTGSRSAWVRGAGGCFLALAFMIAGCAPAVGTMAPGAGAPADASSAAPARPLGPGVTHRFEQRTEGPWAIHVVEIDPRVCGVELRTAKGTDSMIGRETTSEIFSRQATAGAPAVAAVNADFFRYEPDGVPEGPQVAAGEIVAAAGTYGPSVSTRFGIPQPVFGVTRSGRAFVGEVALAGQAWSDEGAFPLARANAAPGPDSLALINTFAGDTAPGTSAPTHAQLRVISRGGGAGALEVGVVERVDSGATSAQVEPGTRILSGNGSAASWIRALAAGDTVRWHLAFAGAPGAVDELVGGFPLLLLDGEPVLHRVPTIRAAFSDARHPRTAVAIRGDGTILLVVVDGRQEGYSEGMTLPELTDLLLELGAVDALNLDGGGSTTLVTVDGIANRPSDQRERPISNALLVRSGGCDQQTR